MLEVVLVAVFITLAVIAAGSRGRMAPAESPFAEALTLDDADTDLPCPWCRAQTSEDDPACPACGQLFG